MDCMYRYIQSIYGTIHTMMGIMDRLYISHASVCGSDTGILSMEEVMRVCMEDVECRLKEVGV